MAGQSYEEAQTSVAICFFSPRANHSRGMVDFSLLCIVDEMQFSYKKGHYVSAVADLLSANGRGPVYS